jgi:5'-nucleotidase / UDP-sugar diphosphatase
MHKSTSRRHRSACLQHAWCVERVDRQAEGIVNVSPLVRLVCLTVIAAASACATAPPNTGGGTPRAGSAGDDAIHILHFNDVYEITPVEAGRTGGLARVAALRRALRDSFPTLVTTLGGDFISPSALGTARVGGQRLNGRQMVDVLNAVGVDIGVLGNHEFDVSRDAFLARMNEARFVMLAANVADSTGRPFPKVLPHLIRRVRAAGRDVRVAFIGVVIPANRPTWTRIADPLDAARREAALLRDSADVIIALTHLNVDDDGRLLTESPDIDAVLGGHEHENYMLRRGPRFAPVIKSDANARSVQIVTIRPPSAGRRAEVESRLQPIVEGMAEDTAVARVVERWVDTAYAGFEHDGFRPRELVVTTPIPLDGREATIRTTTSAMTDLIGAAMRRDVPDAEIAVFNAGSIRIDDVLPAGPITQYDVIRMLPFGGKTIEVRMRGEVLARVLIAGDRNVGRGGYLHRFGVSGSTSAGWTVGGAPLDPTRQYRVAITDYLLTGAEIGIEFLKRDMPGVEVVAEHADIRQAVINEMRARWK